MSSFKLRPRKSLRKTLRGLFADLVENVVSALHVADPPVDAVHAARKSVKRLRALVSAVEDRLTDADWFDHTLRNVNRALAARRDAAVLTETLDELANQAGSSAASDFAAARAVLDQRLATVSQRPLNVLTAVLRPLQAAAKRWHEQRLPDESWELLESNVQRVYRRGRRWLQRHVEHPDGEQLHDLRKYVKRTQYHLELLQPLAPTRLNAEHHEWETLADVLGRHHDLWLLASTLKSTPAAQWSRAARRLVLGEIEAAERLATEMIECQAPLAYAETPRAFVDRLGAYWAAWRQRTRT